MNRLVNKILEHLKLEDKYLNQLKVSRSLSDFQDANGVHEFCSRILKAKENNEKIFVGGDYDADGICATAIMIDTLRTLDIQCGYYIPNRIKEGYGLHVATVEKVAEKGYNLIITVDNGVKSIEAINRAIELGIDVIVSDHHTYEEELPCLLLHSFNMGENYQFLSGAGIALAVAKVLGVHKEEHVVLAGVALLADMMKVWNENRVIIKEAIHYLNQGYVKAIQRFKPKYENWNETTLAFNFIPKLNAAGRLSELIDVNKIVELLISNQEDFINEYVDKLEKVNEIRKTKSNEMISEAISMIKEYSFPIVHSENFHEGMVGIVAGKIVNDYKRPAIVFSKKDNMLKGSARSITGLNLVDFFSDFKHHFTQFGGHDGAAGILIEENKLDLLYEYVNNKEIPEFKSEILKIELEDLTIENVKELDALRPYGAGFKIPMMKLENISIASTVKLGSKPHYKLSINEEIEVLFFNQNHFKVEESKTIHFNQISIKKEKQKEKISIIAVS